MIKVRIEKKNFFINIATGQLSCVIPIKKLKRKLKISPRIKLVEELVFPEYAVIYFKKK